MSKVLLVNSSPNERGCTYTALSEVARTLEAGGVETEILWLGRKPMQDCIACMKCVETGKCAFNDLVNETAARIGEFDGFIFGSPVYYAGPDGRGTSFLDRLFFSASDKFAGKLAAAVVSCRRGGATASFDRLNKYFFISNMMVVGSQYWNMVHGFTPEDVQKDKEGLQIMRTLGRNFIWLLQSIEAGKAQGISYPKHEEITMTNFIR